MMIIISSDFVFFCLSFCKQQKFILSINILRNCLFNRRSGFCFYFKILCQYCKKAILNRLVTKSILIPFNTWLFQLSFMKKVLIWPLSLMLGFKIWWSSVLLILHFLLKMRKIWTFISKPCHIIYYNIYLYRSAYPSHVLNWAWLFAKRPPIYSQIALMPFINDLASIFINLLLSFLRILYHTVIGKNRFHS